MKNNIAKAAFWIPGLRKSKVISIRQPGAGLYVNGYNGINKLLWSANSRVRDIKNTQMSEILAGETCFA